jgi:hypothetical protein
MYGKVILSALMLLTFISLGCEAVKEATEAVKQVAKSAEEATQQAKQAAEQAKTAVEEAQKVATAARTKALEAVKGPEKNPHVDKMNAYIGCINSHSSRIMDSYRRYLSWCNPDQGPTGKERNIYGLYSISAVDDCIKGIETVSEADPRFPPLEEAATAYADALKVVDAAIKSAYDYYDQKDYQDDGMAKGKTLHPGLISAFEDFAIADAKMRSAVDTIESEQKVKELARVEKEHGRNLQFGIMNTMMKAEIVLKLSNTAELDKIDSETIQAAVVAYGEAAKELQEYAGKNESETSELFAFSSFLSATKNLNKSGKELMRRVRDKKTFSKSDRQKIGTSAGWMVDGSPDKLLRDFNALVDAHNRMH